MTRLFPRVVPALLLLSACFTRPGDKYPCANANQCPPLNVCAEGFCRSVFDPGTAASSSSSSSSSAASGASASNGSGGSSASGSSGTSGSSSSSGGLPPLEECAPLAGCEDGGCAFAVDVVTRERSACARMADGTAQCWGGNLEGQLGLGSTAFEVGTPSHMRDLDGGVLHDVVQVARGQPFTCVLFDGGRMGCAGVDFRDSFGPLEQDAGTELYKYFPTLRMNTLQGVRHIAAGDDVACVTTDTETRCFGDPALGRTGGSLPPDLKEVSAGLTHVLAVRQDGTVVAWGDNTEGQLGMTVPQQDGQFWRADAGVVPGVGPARSVSAGDAYGCAVLNAGGVKCWGMVGGQLGREDGGLFGAGQQGASEVLDDSNAPFGPATMVAARYGTTCAILAADRSLWCWGNNAWGQMGQLVTTLGSKRPRRNSNMGSWSRVAMDDYTTCAVNTCGHAYCWGRNERSLLGGVFAGGESGTDEPQRILLLDP